MRSNLGEFYYKVARRSYSRDIVGGRIFVPHWHDADERIILIESQIAIGENVEKKIGEPGGCGYLPVRQLECMSCVSAAPKSHR